MLNLFKEVDIERYPKTIRALGIIATAAVGVAGLCVTAIACQNALMTKFGIEMQADTLAILDTDRIIA